MSTIYVNNIAPKTASGPISFTNDLEASSLTIASLQTSGGLAVVKDARIGGDLIVTGNYINSIRTVTSSSLVDAADSYILCNSATAATVTLFAATNNEGRRIDIKNINVGVITIACDGVETIDGLSTFVLGSKYDTLTIISDDTQWLIL